MSSSTMPGAPQQEQFQFYEAGEHIIRHGDALRLREPKQLSYKGRLDTPQLWLTPKKALYKATEATVRVNFTEGSIELTLVEKNELYDYVGGSLTDSPELGYFGINKDKRYTLDELVTLLKRYRFFFPNKDQHQKTLIALQNFSAKVETKYEQVRSNNGASKNNLEREVHGIDWEREFTLSVPVFKGYSAESFRVEIGVDPTSAGVKFFLDSPELFELQADLKTRLLAEEIKYFTEWGCSLIYVS
jgi:hypothetical protein